MCKDTDKEICPKCDGLGEIVRYHTESFACPTCLGAGVITSYKKETDQWKKLKAA